MGGEVPGYQNEGLCRGLGEAVGMLEFKKILGDWGAPRDSGGLGASL